MRKIPHVFNCLDVELVEQKITDIIVFSKKTFIDIEKSQERLDLLVCQKVQEALKRSVSRKNNDLFIKKLICK